MPNTSMKAAPRYCPIGRLLFITSGRLLNAQPMHTLITVMIDSAAVEPMKLHHLPTCGEWNDQEANRWKIEWALDWVCFAS